MKSYIISKSDLGKWLEGLIKHNEVIAPVKKENFTAFAPVHSAKEIVWGAPQTVIPPKAFLYPQSEDLLSFELGGEAPLINALNVVKPRILFGAHPCDLNGIFLMDQVWAEKNRDENYLYKRHALTVIGVDCLIPCAPESICLTMGGINPKGRFDLFLTDMGKSFYVEAATGKGEKLIKGLGKAAGRADTQKLARLRKKRDGILAKKQKQLVSRRSELPKLMQKSYQHEEWEKRAKKCYSCGSCNAVCPTCYCFDVQDYMHVNLVKGVRGRCWDGCMLEEFAKVASGENFREERSGRLRHRTYRKLNFLFEKWGESYCTGCGRCVKACLTKIVSPVEIANALTAKVKK